jgi:hypothetical protein
LAEFQPGDYLTEEQSSADSTVAALDRLLPRFDRRQTSRHSNGNPLFLHLRHRFFCAAEILARAAAAIVRFPFSAFGAAPPFKEIAALLEVRPIVFSDGLSAL